jgi:1-acyl-sn-glycerol-3-phosphate acyltransferase
MSSNRFLRIIGTGSSFLVFGAGALVLGIVVYPVLSALPGGRPVRERRMQRAIHLSFRFFVKFMEAVGTIRVTVRDGDRLRGSGARLVVANHPSLIDYVLLVSLLPQADCVAKRAIWNNPITRGVVRGAGYVPNDSGEAMIGECARRLREGRTVLVFPEGTRSPARGLGRFQRGAAHVAIESGVPLLPVTIRCEPPGLMRGQKWYEVPERRMTFTLEVGVPIAAETHGEHRAMASRAITDELREYFAKRLGI